MSELIFMGGKRPPVSSVWEDFEGTSLDTNKWTLIGTKQVVSNSEVAFDGANVYDTNGIISKDPLPRSAGETLTIEYKVSTPTEGGGSQPVLRWGVLDNSTTLKTGAGSAGWTTSNTTIHFRMHGVTTATDQVIQNVDDGMFYIDVTDTTIRAYFYVSTTLFQATATVTPYSYVAFNRYTDSPTKLAPRFDWVDYSTS